MSEKILGVSSEKEKGCIVQILYAILGLLLVTLISIAIGFPLAWLFDKIFPSSGTSDQVQTECDLFGCHEI